MEKKFKELQTRLNNQHKDLPTFIQHFWEALDDYKNQHRKEVALNALAGVKPNGEEEYMFYEQINHLKQIGMDVLEKTIEDLEHKGDKYWTKHFKDGINM